MTELFLTVLQMSLMAAGVVLIALPLRWLFRRLRLPALACELLWLVVAVRMLLPVGLVTGPFSVLGWLTPAVQEQTEALARTEEIVLLPAAPDPAPPAEPAPSFALPEAVPAPEEAAPAAEGLSVLDVLAWLWLAGVLAVWGSPGSGKTTVAVRLAKYLADKRRNVILLLCDMTAPMLPCICPAADLECERSLGSVLAAAHVSENLVKNNLVTHKRLGYLTMLGMLKGENEYTYPPYNEVQARELIDCLREIAPYVVIDCGSYIANDILSAVALMEADSVLRLANADLKSISYLSSQLPLLRDAKWDTDKQYKTASNVKSQQAGDHMSQALGTVAFTLPHSAELEGQYLAGNLLADLSMKDSRVFRKEIEKIAREVFGC